MKFSPHNREVLINAATVCSIITFLTYMIFSYILMDFNALNWNTENREGYVCCVVLILIMGAIYYWVNSYSSDDL